jgi:hypothetical protein
MKVKNYARYLLDNGLIFEINRKVLHPLGLAMFVEVDDDDNRLVKMGGLYDAEEDPEGWIFDPETFEEGRSKYHKFLDEFGQAKLDQRQEKLGYIIQEDGKA